MQYGSCPLCKTEIKNSRVNYNGINYHYNCYWKHFVYRPNFREKNFNFGEYVIRIIKKKKFTYQLMTVDSSYYNYSGYKAILVKRRNDITSLFCVPKQIKGYSNIDAGIIDFGLNYKKDIRFLKLAKKWNDNRKAVN